VKNEWAEEKREEREGQVCVFILFFFLFSTHSLSLSLSLVQNGGFGLNLAMGVLWK